MSSLWSFTFLSGFSSFFGSRVVIFFLLLPSASTLHLTMLFLCHYTPHINHTHRPWCVLHEHLLTPRRFPLSCYKQASFTTATVPNHHCIVGKQVKDTYACQAKDGKQWIHKTPELGSNSSPLQIFHMAFSGGADVFNNFCMCSPHLQWPGLVASPLPHHTCCRVQASLHSWHSQSTTLITLLRRHALWQLILITLLSTYFFVCVTQIWIPSENIKVKPGLNLPYPCSLILVF